MAWAARLRGAATRALLLPLLLLLLPPPPLLARAPRSPVSARRRLAAPRQGAPGTRAGPGGRAGPTGMPGVARRGPLPEKLSGFLGGVIDSELPVPGGVQVEPAPGSLRLVSGTPRPLPALGPAPRRPGRDTGVCVGGGTAGVATGPPIHCRDKAQQVSGWRQPPDVWPP